MEKRVFPIICLLAALLMALGCAPKRPAYDALYARLVETAEEYDSGVLAGRRIVIDPGHGGCFDGVVGADSLSEADANLGVALYLWGLLKEAGALVELTRTTDRDFSGGDTEHLRRDLESRMAIANAHEPEVFISIHHNSNLPLDRERNRIEIYYRANDPEPSAELASDIHTHLSRNLGISDSEIKPASYFVLRTSTAQASVLGEASYLSNPRVEEKLKLSTKQRLEGEAYFLGLVSYFARGIPRIERLHPASDTLEAPGSLSFTVHPGAGVPIDPGTARVRIGNRIHRPHFDGARSLLRCALDPDLPNGSYEVLCTVRSVRGGTAASRPFEILVSRPARFVLPLEPSAAPKNRIYLSLKALDRNGDPVADGAKVTVRSLRTGRVFEGSCRKGRFGFETDRTELTSLYLAELPGLSDTLRFDHFDRDGLVPLLVMDSRMGERIPAPLAVSIEGEDDVRGDARGLLLLPTEEGGLDWIVSARGYRMAPLSIGETGGAVSLEPLFGGALMGSRIAIDPAGGGSDHQGMGDDKLRGATVNMEIARNLADILTGGGAAVTLSRRGEETLSIEERIYKINRFRPDIAVRIRLAEGDETACTVFHYPGSERGMSLAGELARRLDGLPPCAEWRVAESAARFLQQTSCPAVEICSGAIAHGEHERILSNPLHARMKAERIAASIIAMNGREPIEQKVTIVMDGAPVEGAAVSIDQVLTSITDESGCVEFACVLPGEHILTVVIPGESLARLIPFSVTDGSPATLSLESRAGTDPRPNLTPR